MEKLKNEHHGSQILSCMKIDLSKKFTILGDFVTIMALVCLSAGSYVLQLFTIEGMTCLSCLGISALSDFHE